MSHSYWLIVISSLLIGHGLTTPIGGIKVDPSGSSYIINPDPESSRESFQRPGRPGPKQPAPDATTTTWMLESLLKDLNSQLPLDSRDEITIEDITGEVYGGGEPLELLPVASTTTNSPSASTTTANRILNRLKNVPPTQTASNPAGILTFRKNVTNQVELPEFVIRFGEDKRTTERPAMTTTRLSLMDIIADVTSDLLMSKPGSGRRQEPTKSSLIRRILPPQAEAEKENPLLRHREMTNPVKDPSHEAFGDSGGAVSDASNTRPSKRQDPPKQSLLSRILPPQLTNQKRNPSQLNQRTVVDPAANPNTGVSESPGPGRSQDPSGTGLLGRIPPAQTTNQNYDPFPPQQGNINPAGNFQNFGPMRSQDPSRSDPTGRIPSGQSTSQNYDPSLRQQGALNPVPAPNNGPIRGQDPSRNSLIRRLLPPQLTNDNYDHLLRQQVTTNPLKETELITAPDPNVFNLVVTSSLSGKNSRPPLDQQRIIPLSNHRNVEPSHHTRIPASSHVESHHVESWTPLTNREVQVGTSDELEEETDVVYSDEDMDFDGVGAVLPGLGTNSVRRTESLSPDYDTDDDPSVSWGSTEVPLPPRLVKQNTGFPPASDEYHNNSAPKKIKHKEALSGESLTYVLLGTLGGITLIFFCVVGVIVRCRQRRFRLRELQDLLARGLGRGVGKCKEDMESNLSSIDSLEAPKRQDLGEMQEVSTHKLGSWFNGRQPSLRGAHDKSCGEMALPSSTRSSLRVTRAYFTDGSTGSTRDLLTRQESDYSQYDSPQTPRAVNNDSADDLPPELPPKRNPKTPILETRNLKVPSPIDFGEDSSSSFRSSSSCSIEDERL